MTDILTLLNRFENAAGVYERSDDPAARDELHAARRAIVEREAELVKALDAALSYLEGTNPLHMAGGHRNDAVRHAIRSALRTTS